ncbi:MAG: CPBP family intramembrane glutamic endopeptidase [Propionibacteriaceae bacterium]
MLVLGVSLGQSAVYSILRIIDLATRRVALNQQTTSLNSSVTPDRPWLDLLYQLVGVVFPVLPALLALYLLSVWPGRPGRLIGFNLARPVFDLGFGLGIAACIGIPGLGLYLGARELGFNTTIAAGNLTASWYAIPIYCLQAAMNGVLEEVIMIGYLYTRFRQLGWRWPVVIIVSAVVRGSYHLYQGYGGFAGNLIMGAVFGLIYLKWKRVMTLVVAHTVLDIVSFVGYALVAPRVSWL